MKTTKEDRKKRAKDKLLKAEKRENDKYTSKPVPMTEDEEERLIRLGRNVGITTMGTGAAGAGLGYFIDRNAEKIAKTGTKVPSKGSIKTLKVGGISALAGGAALTGISAYSHYKNKKKKEKDNKDNSSEKIKNFSDEGQVSSKDLLAEQLKLQKTLMEVQKKREQTRSDETKARISASQQQQRTQQKKDEETNKALRASMRRSNSESSLYKVASRPVPPVPMKI